MKRTMLTLLASMTFIIFRVIGESMGKIVADLYYWVLKEFMGVDLFSYVVVIGENIIAGVLGGVLAAWGCSFLYKYYSMTVMMIIPSLCTALFVILGLMSVYSNAFSLNRVAQFISQFIGLYTFYFMLKGKYRSKFTSVVEDK